MRTLPLSTVLINVLVFNQSCKQSEISNNNENKRPNILFVIADDQSWPHASAYGCEAIRTPAFDKIASEGVLFNNCFVNSPGCAPSRASILTGRQQWQLDTTGVHGGIFSIKYKTFPKILENAGYFIGFTGKGWSPGNYEKGGWKHNPVGHEYNNHKTEFVPKTVPIFNVDTLKDPNYGQCTYSVRNFDYSRDFLDFIEEKPDNQPFCFWFGAHEPHETYRTGAGIEAGLQMDKVKVPSFLPDVPEIRRDFLDYFYEIMWYDAHLARMLHYLEQRDMLENTIIIVTSDNGMPFARAKANLYEYGIHVPLAISWGSKLKQSRPIDHLVSFVDLAPTILELTGVKAGDLEYPMTGNSFANLLLNKDYVPNKAVFASREQHAHSRYKHAGYPQRSIRTKEYLFIKNYKPERWPAGSPYKLKTDGTLDIQGRGFFDIDDFHIDYIGLHRYDKEIKPYFDLAVAKRPPVELYNIINDPACIINLANKPEYKKLRDSLHIELTDYLTQTNDPRTTLNGDIMETYLQKEEVLFPSQETEEELFIKYGVDRFFK